MDKTNLFLMLCIFHLIGDYYLQGESIANNKDNHWIDFMKHAFLYSIPFLGCVLCERLFWGTTVSIFFLWCVLFHAIIDIIKIGVKKIISTYFEMQFVEISETVIYFIDQTVHITCLIFVIIYFNGTLLSISNYYVVTAVPYILYFLCLLKPANITFKILFSRFQVKNINNKNTSSKDGAGACIGNLERLLCGIFILLGQFSAVGLTMTAKSVARYDEITKNPAFAEYYLIGTLYSILYTVILYCLIFKFIL